MMTKENPGFAAPPREIFDFAKVSFVPFKEAPITEEFRSLFMLCSTCQRYEPECQHLGGLVPWDMDREDGRAQIICHGFLAL